MGDCFITPIWEKVVDCAVSQGVKQVGYVVDYKKNLKELDDKMKELRLQRESIQHRVEEEERKLGSQIEKGVQDWVQRVDMFINEATNLVQDSRKAGVEVECHRWHCPDLRQRRKLSMMALQMAENAGELKDEATFDTIAFRAPIDIWGKASNSALPFKSREPIMKDIMEALKDPNKRIIGVYGLGGVGKTTLADQVARKAQEDKLFKAVVKAKAGKNPQVDKIQDDIAELLGMKLDQRSPTARSCQIRKVIETERSILVILDDVCETFKLEDVGIPDPASIMNLKDNNEGIKASSKANIKVDCKIFLTSRSEDNLRLMGSENNFCLNPLLEDEALHFLKDMAGLQVNGELEGIATQVAQKCRGLPFVISFVAKTALKNKTSIEDWNIALRKLEANKEEIIGMIHSEFESSYKQLTSEVRTLFLLCGTTGGFNNVGDLLKYGIGLGIFKNKNTIGDARDNLSTMINSLKASCLLLDDIDDKEFVTMHEVVRDVAISIASRNQYFFTKKKDTEWPEEDDLKGCHLIQLHGHCIQKLPKRLDCPELEFFGLNSLHSSDFPQSFFEGMHDLKVLDLTDMALSSLPTSLASLTKLKTLCLDFCKKLENMAGIGDLRSLQVLSLLGLSMRQLPSEIGKLTHLRMLDLSRSSIQVIPPKVISKLIKLEELYMGNSSIIWGAENSSQQNKTASLAELGHLINLTCLEIQIQDPRMQPKDFKFQKLARYKIIIGDKWDWSEKYEASSKTLKLTCDSKINLERWVKALIKTVESLYLDGNINGISNVLYQLNKKGFPQLKLFHIQNNTKIKHIVYSKEGNQAHHESFPKLEILVLENLSNLEKICHGPLMVNSFGKLRVIKVKNCHKLKYLMLVSMVQVLSQLLEEIKVSKCNSVKNIVFMEAEDQNDTTSDKIEFTRLRSLTLQHLPMIDDFCSNGLISSATQSNYNLSGTNIPTYSLFSAKLAFPNLETLIVNDCGGLKYLFSPFMAHSFSNLKQLKISNCQMMEEIIATERINDDDTSSTEVGFSKLEKMSIHNMENLRVIWHYQFEKLKMLEVVKCDKLQNIFPSHMQTTYQSVETLEVSECNSVKEIFELSGNGTAVTAQLKDLTLSNLPKLKRIWSKDPHNITGFPYLQSVDIEECEVLEYIFPFSVATNLLQLKEISVRQAYRMKEIVSRKEGAPMDSSSTVNFELNHLASLWLSDLHQLEGFYAANHNLACPSLKILYVLDCSKLKLFDTQYRSEGRISDHQFNVSMLQSLFQVDEKWIPILEELTLRDEESNMIFRSKANFWQSKKKKLSVSGFVDEESAFPNWLLQYLFPLRRLSVEDSAFKKIFQDEKGQITNSSRNNTRLKKLKLRSLSQLEHLCEEGFQIDPILELLESLYVEECPKLTHLVPSSVTFTQLSYMEVQRCRGMIHLFTSSTAASLGSLTHMKIQECDALEQVVTTQDASKETEGREIVFRALERIELEGLPRLTKFCTAMCSLKFPLLAQIVVKQCKRMQVISVKEAIALKLEQVQADDNCWTPYSNDDIDGDLKRNINRIFHHLAKQSSTSTNINSIEKLKKEHATLEDPSKSASGSGSGQSHDSEITPVENLLPNQPTSSITADNKENVQEMCECEATTSIQDAEEESRDPKILIGETMFYHTTTPITVDNREEEAHVPIGENWFIQTTTSISADNKESNVAQEEKPLVQPDWKALNPIFEDAEVEAYTSYKGMLEISEENLAYLEAGLKRHPQVLEWLIPKRRRTVLASTSFTLFAEVTRLLRTTRRCELRQDVRDYIRDCCTSLQALGFDASWLRYVHTCLDECGPIINNPLIIQQTEAKASSLKAQLESLKNELASFEASLVSLHHHNSRLYDFIES